MAGATAIERPASWGQRREEMIATASKLMSEGGYRAVSMERLAAELRVTKPTVYYYLDSKGGLWAALADLAETNSARLREKCLELTDPAERLRAVIHESVEQSTGDMRWMSGLLDRDHFPDDLDTVVAERLNSAAQVWFHTVISTVRSAVAAEVLPELDPILTALNLIAMSAWCAKWYRRDVDADPDQIEDAILGLVLQSHSLQTHLATAPDARTRSRARKTSGRKP